MSVIANTSRVLLRSAHHPKKGEAKKEPIELMATAQPVKESANLSSSTNLTKSGLIEGKTMEKQTEAKKVIKSIIAIPALWDSFVFGIKAIRTSSCSVKILLKTKVIKNGLQNIPNKFYSN